MVASPLEDSGGPRLPWLLPVALVVVFVAALAGVLVLARQAAESDAPPEPDAFGGAPPTGWLTFDVERAEAGQLRLVAGGGKQSEAIDLAIGAETPVWLLEPASLADLRAPLVVNVIGIPNEVRNFTIRLLAFGPAPGSEALTGEFVPLAGGFAGHETSQDARERPVVSGIVERFDGATAFVRTVSGQVTIEIEPGAPVRLLRKGNAGAISAGDRVAFRRGSDGGPDLGGGVLVLPAAAGD